MTNQEIKEALEKQLQLLSKRSAETISTQELCDISTHMNQLALTLLSLPVSSLSADSQTLNKVDNEMDYSVTAWKVGQPDPLGMEVSFSLAYRDWCELEKSKIWAQLQYFVGQRQKEHSRLPRQVTED